MVYILPILLSPEDLLVLPEVIDLSELKLLDQTIYGSECID